MTNIINKYKQLISTDVEDLTDEQITEICDIECNIDETVDNLLLEYKIFQNRCKIAEKNMENIKKMVYFYMTRTEKENFLWENWKISSSKYWKWDLNIDNIPKELLTVNYQTINAKLNKWEKINWIIPTISHISYNIR